MMENFLKEKKKSNRKKMKLTCFVPDGENNDIYTIFFLVRKQPVSQRNRTLESLGRTTLLMTGTILRSNFQEKIMTDFYEFCLENK